MASVLELLYIYNEAALGNQCQCLAGTDIIAEVICDAHAEQMLVASAYSGAQNHLSSMTS